MSFPNIPQKMHIMPLFSAESINEEPNVLYFISKSRKTCLLVSMISETLVSRSHVRKENLEVFIENRLVACLCLATHHFVSFHASIHLSIYPSKPAAP